MPLSRPALALAVLALGAGSITPALADKPGDTDTTKGSAKASQSYSCDGGDVFLKGSNVLWPPNHKMVTLTAVADTDETYTQPEVGTMETTISLLTAQVIDDLSGGDGNHGPDSSLGSSGSDTDANDTAADGTADAPYDVRAERSGKGEGRTYVIDWSATFDNGDSCSSNADSGDDLKPFTVFVPHDQGKGNDA